MSDIKLLPEVKVAWLAALRSGDYRQGTSKLTYFVGDGKDRQMYNCCLGVLCEIAVAAGAEVLVADDGYERTYDHCDGLLPQSVYQYATGAVSSSTETDIHVVVEVDRDCDDEDCADCASSYMGLGEVNDGGADFDGIALLIEAQL